MSTLDVTPWPQGLALDSGTNMRPGFEGRVILRFLLFFYGFYSGEVALVALMAFGFCG